MVRLSDNVVAPVTPRVPLAVTLLENVPVEPATVPPLIEPVTSPVTSPVIFPVTSPVTFPVRFPENPQLDVTVPEAVIAPVVIEEGLVPISIIVAPESSVKSLLSAVFTASSPCTKSEAVGTADEVEENLVIIVAIMSCSNNF